MKSYLRRYGSAFRSAVDDKDDDSVLLFFHTALGSITCEHAKGWMSHSGYL